AALVSANADRTAEQAGALHDARFQHLKEQKAEQAALGAALVSANADRTAEQAGALHDARFQHLKEQKAEQAALGAALVSANAERTAEQHIDNFAVQGRLAAQQQSTRDDAQDTAIVQAQHAANTGTDHAKEIEANSKAISNTDRKLSALASQQHIDSVYYGDQIKALANNVAGEASEINKNSAAISSTQTKVADNSRQISKLNSNFSSLKSQVDSDRKEYRSGIATATALAGMPQVNSNQTFMVSAAAGTFKDASAIAVGGSANVSDHVVVKFGVSDSTENDVAANVGIGYGF
ncbi:YadA-like family protein, partial [Leclercia adecarboxylata]|uniref:YadA-like family protein n=1 Tax=Leclercia adecarboxylata TaxID=83655 RepID=UPI002DB873C5